LLLLVLAAAFAVGLAGVGFGGYSGAAGQHGAPDDLRDSPGGGDPDRQQRHLDRHGDDYLHLSVVALRQGRRQLLGHVVPEVEVIVDHTDRYELVEKLGAGAYVAKRLDPRQQERRLNAVPSESVPNESA